MRKLVVVVLALLMSSCKKGDLIVDTETVSLPVVVDLHVGQSVRLPEQGVSVRFVKVTADSRCPAGLECFWEGDAGVRLMLLRESMSARDCTLHTTLEPKQVSVTPLLIRLKVVAPYPKYGSTINPSDYVATISLDSIRLVLWRDGM